MPSLATAGECDEVLERLHCGTVLRLDADTGNHAVVLKIYARGRATGENLGRAAVTSGLGASY